MNADKQNKPEYILGIAHTQMLINTLSSLLYIRSVASPSAWTAYHPHAGVHEDSLITSEILHENRVCWLQEDTFQQTLWQI